MTTYATGKRPLLRGTLHPADWWAEPNDPETEHLAGTLAVWCPYCGNHHYHGWQLAKDGRHAEHRVAHCRDNGSPFHEHGYWIAPYRQSEPEAAGHEIKPGVAVSRPTPPLRRRLYDRRREQPA